MTLHSLLRARSAAGRPVRVGLIGAGKFGTMFLNQVPTTPGLEVAAVADLSTDRILEQFGAAGWEETEYRRVAIFDDGLDVVRHPDVEVVIEATGSPEAGIRHAREAIAAGKHVVMVTVEADALAGPLLAQEADEAGVVYSMAYGDQPALVAEMVDWACCCGFPIVAAGKGTRFLPGFHQSTPDTVWGNIGYEPDQARAEGLNPQMFNSFVDGTKSAIEMAAIANACDLAAPSAGLSFPPCGVDDLAYLLRPRADGGMLEGKGMVEVVASEERDGRPVFRDLRWGVYVVFEAPNGYAVRSLARYGVGIERTGKYAALYRPFHLIGLELNQSILSAALRGEPTGVARAFNADVVAVAKTDLAQGRMLDGEGGYCVWGKLAPAAESLTAGALPIGLSHGVRLKRSVAAGDTVRWDDAEVDTANPAVQFRRAMEQRFGRRT